MKPLASILTMLALLASCNSPSKKKESIALKLDSLTADSYRKLFSSDSFDWESIEVEVSDAEKHEFVKSHFPYILNRGDSSYLSSVHALDINNDGKNDFVYSGPGPVTTYTVVAITGDAAVFQDQSTIINMDIVDKKVRRLYTNSLLGSGAPGIQGYSIVDISYGADSIRFVPRMTCEQVHSLVAPVNFSSFEAEASVDSLIVRRAPSVYDTIYDFALERKTTQLGKIMKGTKAIIAGTSIDSLNTKWYFSLIEPGIEIYGYPYMNMTFNPNDNMYRIVWTKAEGWKK